MSDPIHAEGIYQCDGCGRTYPEYVNGCVEDHDKPRKVHLVVAGGQRMRTDRLLHAIDPLKYKHPDSGHVHELMCDPVAWRLGLWPPTLEETDR